MRAEAAALLLLTRRRNDAISQGLSRGRSLNAIASSIENDFRDGIISARRESRNAGLLRLGAEARNIGTRLVSDYTHMAEAAVDAARAKLYAGNFGRLWLSKAAAAPGRITQAADAANLATTARLATVGVSESAEAFNRGRARYLRLATDVRLLKVWDATLDKWTCPRCSEADGTIVFARDRFPLGEPGAVHARCRCSFQIIGSSERYTPAAKPPATAAPAVAKTKAPPAPSSLRPKPVVKAATVVAPKPALAPKPVVTKVAGPAPVPKQVAAKAPVAAPQSPAVADTFASKLSATGKLEGRAASKAAAIVDEHPDASALRGYTASSGGVNHYMRERAAGGPFEAEIENEIARIRGVMRDVRTGGAGLDGVVIRSERIVTDEQWLAYTTADTIKLDAFVSTTTSVREAREFAGIGRRATMHISQAGGTPVGKLSVFDKSHEVLLEPGKFRVVGRSVKGDAIDLYLEQL